MGLQYRGSWDLPGSTKPHPSMAEEFSPTKHPFLTSLEEQIAARDNDIVGKPS